MIEKNFELRFTDPLDERGIASEQPGVTHVLVIEGRQHQSLVASQGDGVAGELDRVRQRAAAGSDHHPVGRDTALERRFHQRFSLVDGERVGLAGGAEYGEAVAASLEHQPGVL